MLAFHVHVQFRQTVFLERNPKTLVVAPTWSKGIIGGAGDSLFVSYTRQAVSDLVDEFLNDYLAANPKESASKKRNRLEGLLKETKPKEE